MPHRKEGNFEIEMEEKDEEEDGGGRDGAPQAVCNMQVQTGNFQPPKQEEEGASG